MILPDDLSPVGHGRVGPWNYLRGKGYLLTSNHPLPSKLLIENTDRPTQTILAASVWLPVCWMLSASLKKFMVALSGCFQNNTNPPWLVQVTLRDHQHPLGRFSCGTFDFRPMSVFAHRLDDATRVTFRHSRGRLRLDAENDQLFLDDTSQKPHLYMNVEPSETNAYDPFTLPVVSEHPHPLSTANQYVLTRVRYR